MSRDRELHSLAEFAEAIQRELMIQNLRRVTAEADAAELQCKLLLAQIQTQQAIRDNIRKQGRDRE